MNAELPAALTAVAAALADFKASSAPPAMREWMQRLGSTMDELMAVLGAEEDQAEEDARRLTAIRDLLAGFDREAGDPQRALDTIGRIVEAGQ